MWEKIKAFFAKRSVQTVEVIVMLLCAVGLAIGGWKAEDFHSLVDYVGAAIIAILAAAKFINNVIKRKG